MQNRLREMFQRMKLARDGVFVQQRSSRDEVLPYNVGPSPTVIRTEVGQYGDLHLYYDNGTKRSRIGGVWVD